MISSNLDPIMKISSLQRIYISSQIVLGQQITLDQDQTHYLTSVMRLKIGWRIRVFNEANGEFIAQVSSINKKSCTLEAVELFRPPMKMPRLHLAQGIIKGDRMTQALSMATQLGVTEISPIITERAQAKSINHERIMRVLIENSEQSERLSIPQLREPKTLEEFVTKGDFDILFYANENEEGSNAWDRNDESKISILIGPEGGFTEAELEMLAACPKARSVSLGATVLRSETATAALISLVRIGR